MYIEWDEQPVQVKRDGHNDGFSEEQQNLKRLKIFLKTIFKIPVPKELGEAPEYKPEENRQRADFERQGRNQTEHAVRDPEAILKGGLSVDQEKSTKTIKLRSIYTIFIHKPSTGLIFTSL